MSQTMSATQQAGVNTAEQTTSQTRGDSAPNLNNPFTGRTASQDLGKVFTNPERSTSVDEGSLPSPGPEGMDRRMSKEWDAAKVPPSRFQKREGSIFSTASSRDSHISRKERDRLYHDKLKEKGWL